MKRLIFFLFILLAVIRCFGAGSELPFKLYRDYLIVVKCSVGPLADLTAIIDTGVSETVLDLALLKRLSLDTQADTATFLNHESEVRAVSIPLLQLGPVRVEHLSGIATDLSLSTSQMGIRPDLLIGMDVLHRQSLVIDYRARKLTFGESTPLKRSATLIAGGRFAILEATSMGKKMRLQVDTGINGLLLYSKTFAPQAQGSTTDPGVVSAAGAAKVRTVDSVEIKVGDWRTFRGTVFVLPGESPAADFDGLLGPRWLEARRVALDFEKMVLWWE